jgi:uncharacterized membrane protein
MKIVDALMTLALAVVAGSLAPVPSVGQETPTRSEYRYTIVDYPGSASACLSINTRLDVICDALFNQELPFVYDARLRRITLPATAQPAGWSAAAFGINDWGTVVGYVYPPDDSIENGFVVTKNGEYQEFSVPWAAYTEARGINNRGVITGTAFFSGPGSAGFIYDPEAATYTEVLPSAYTETVGITTDGHVVGTVYLDAGASGPGAPAGQYGYLRAANGSVKYFRVNGEDTYARGISDEGKIVGYFGALPIPQVTGFVTDVKELHSPKTPAIGFVALTIPARKQLQIPGAIGTLPQGISIEGVVSGAFIDGSGNAHGFIARPNDD